MKRAWVRVLVAATLPVIAVLVAAMTAGGPATTVRKPTSQPPSEAAAFPFSARYVETTEEKDRLLARDVYQFTGSSWDDFTVMLLSSNDDAGPVSQSHVGYVSRYQDGVLLDGWLKEGSNELERLSIEEVNALLGDFPGNAESVQQSTVPGGEQAPSPLFNRRWLKFEGLTLPSEAPTEVVEPETSTAATPDLPELHRVLSNPGARIPEAAVARLLDVPARSVVTVTGGDGSSIHVETRKEIVFALGSGIPLAGRVTFGPIVETLLVTELGPPAPVYAQPIGQPPTG